ncbi:hypothetical protein A2U01_0092846, partial [Trifolium medium]|nr:hypothetical protein [Trifolium medium]
GHLVMMLNTVMPSKGRSKT